MAIINFQGKAIHTCADLPKIGVKAPQFELVSAKLKNITLKNYAGKTKVLVIVPSLDTPTCATSARKFNQTAAKLDNTIVLLISADLPFAQSRFCTTEGIKNLVSLSSFRSNFAEDYGVKLTDSILAGLSARAIIIIDTNDKIIYTELVADIANEPNYKDVIEILKS